MLGLCLHDGSFCVLRLLGLGVLVGLHVLSGLGRALVV